MARKTSDYSDDTARIAELEADNAALRQEAMERKREAAELADEVFKERGPQRPAKVFLALLWALIAFRVFLKFLPLAGDVVFIGAGALLLEHWAIAQYRADRAALALKAPILAFGLAGAAAAYAGGRIGDGHDHVQPVASLVCATFAILLAESPFCEWLIDGFRHPFETMRGIFRNERRREDRQGSGAYPAES